MKVRFFGFVAFGFLIPVQSFGQSPQPKSADSLAAFQTDSAKLKSVHDIEAGARPHDTTTALQSDSLESQLRHRGFYLAATMGLSFSNLSAKGYFSRQMDSMARRDSLSILQPYDPVHISFPAGLLLGIPVLPNFDLWLRTEHFWYKPKGLAKGSGPTEEYWYAVQAHLAGVGARFMVPTALLSVNGRQGLYLAYTHFWNFGPTGMYAPTGAIRAKVDPAGAGFEIQMGFQQNFERHWVITGGLAYSRLSFQSKSSWRAILPTAPDESAAWELNSLKLCFLGMYQFGAKK